MMENNTFNNSFNQENESTFHLVDIWHLIWDHKWWYLLSLTVCLVIAAFQLYRTPMTYSSSAKVIIDESGQDATMRNLGVATAGMMRGRSGINNIENEMESLASLDLMEKVVANLDLQTTYMVHMRFKSVDLATDTPIKMVLAGENPHTSFSFNVTNLGEGKVKMNSFMIGGHPTGEDVEGALGDTLVTPVGRVALFPTIHINDFNTPIAVSWTNSITAAKKYCGKLSVSLSGKESSVVILSVTDTDPKRASEVVGALIDAYNEVWLNNKNRAAVNTTKFINERLTVIERDLSAVEEALRQYKSSNNLTDIKAVSQIYLDESSHYATKAFEVRNQLSVAKFIKDYLNDPSNAMALIPANLGIANSSVDSEIREYNDYVLQRDRLVAGSGINNPMIADLNSTIASIRSAILSSIENLISTLQLQLSRIEGQERQILARISSSSGQELQLLSIERQHEITQELYKFLLQKREENEIAALVNVGNTRVLQSPGGAVSLVGPNQMMILLAALVIGFGLPFAIFFLRKMMDTMIKTKSDLGNLSVPFLAEIPDYIVKKGFKFIRRRKGDKLTKILVEPGNRNMMNEAYRVLRTNMDLMLGRTSKSHVVMITSFNPNSGKTFSSLNIAASMALKDAKVIMVDLDMRKGTLGKVLGFDNSGVAAYLSGKTDSYKNGIREVSQNLYALPIGSLPPNPTELLLTDRFRKMIDELKNEYDYVILDCPPIDIVADASIITQVVDMTVFVIRSNRMDKKIIPALEELYRSGKYNHMTMILNCVDSDTQRYGYGRSGYGYGYGGYGYGN